MPKAKFKRKGAPVPLFEYPAKRRAGCDEFASADAAESSEHFLSCEGHQTNVGDPESKGQNSGRTLTDLPEEVICLILAQLDVRTIVALEATSKHFRQVLSDARVWRRILTHKLDFEPDLSAFLTEYENDMIRKEKISDQRSFKKILGNLQTKVHQTWRNNFPPLISRAKDVYGQTMENHTLCQIMSSGRYFVAFYRTEQNVCENNVIDIIDVFDRCSSNRVCRIHCEPSKVDIFRIVEELGLFLLSHPGLLQVKLVWLGKDDYEYLDVTKPGEAETGSICDIVVRDYISIRGKQHRRVIMVALNTEPVKYRHFHIGELQFYSLSEKKEVGKVPLSCIQFHPVRLSFGRFFNQCIQKKGLSDFNDKFAFVVVGGCEGSAVLGVVNIKEGKLMHKLPLKDPAPLDQEDGCERGLCQCSVVSLMIDRRQTDSCAVLLSTGQVLVIHLPTGNTIFHKHLQFDGQIKQALHRPGLLGTQRIGIKFRNFVSFYDLIFNGRGSEVKLHHVRTVLITGLDTDGRETRMDERPSQELTRQFCELQRRIKALNKYTSGIQKKMDKGLRPGTFTQGLISVAKKVQLVTNKLGQAHGKAREIEAVVIGSIAFDNRYCHALTLNRDLVSIDIAGALKRGEALKKVGRKSRAEKSELGDEKRETRQGASERQAGQSTSKKR